MMSWIAAIQANNNPDEDVSVSSFSDFGKINKSVMQCALKQLFFVFVQENGVTSQSVIIRRMKTVEQETSG